MVAVARVRHRGRASLWLALVSGPLAWLLDEGICLVITANVCSGPLHVVPTWLVVPVFGGVGLLALAAIAIGTLTARGWMDDRRADARPAIAVERAQFLAHAAVLLGSLSAFGVLLRMMSAFASPACS